MTEAEKTVLRRAIRLIELSLTRQDPSRVIAIRCIQSLIDGQPWISPPTKSKWLDPLIVREIVESLQ